MANKTKETKIILYCIKHKTQFNMVHSGPEQTKIRNKIQVFCEQLLDKDYFMKVKYRDTNVI